MSKPVTLVAALAAAALMLSGCSFSFSVGNVKPISKATPKPAGPTINNAMTCVTLDKSGACPQNTSTFPATTTKIYATVDYANLTPGDVVQIKWRSQAQGDKVVKSQELTIPNNPDASFITAKLETKEGYSWPVGSYSVTMTSTQHSSATATTTFSITK